MKIHIANPKDSFCRNYPLCENVVKWEGDYCYNCWKKRFLDKPYPKEGGIEESDREHEKLRHHYVER
jgi:hypothetical protein